MNNLPYLLALNRTPGIGPSTVLKLISRWPDLTTLFALSLDEMLLERIPKALAQTLKQLSLACTDEDFRWQDASSNNHLLGIDSEHYPALLKEIPNPPIVLYAKGELSAFNQTALGVVGSRNPSAHGLDNAKQFSKTIASHGVCIVSGLALGVDAQAHIGCLEAQGQTIAVLGTGVDTIYPKRHVRLAQQITEQGLLLSEFPLKSPPTAGHFPQRNRIISGLSSCILVVEAAVKSGSLITARMAIEQNRDVLAIPGSIHNPLARGCHYLLQQGAKLVACAQDVLEELRVTSNPVVTSNYQNKAQQQSNSWLMPFLGYDTISVDELVVRSGYTISDVIIEISQLELQGLINATPGGYIRVCHS